MRRRQALVLAAALAALAAQRAEAQQQPIRIGVTVSETGPAASLGIPQRNSIALLPTEVGGRKIEYTVLDDASDPTKAVTNTRKLVDETHVDAVVGSSTTPASLAMIPVAAEAKTPMVSLAASAAIIRPMDAQKAWVFKAPQNDALGAKNIQIADVERFSRTDSSVTGQVLKAMAAHPDAMLVVGAGTPAALPEQALRDRGFRGPIYQTHGIANADFLRVGGKAVEGTILPAGPVLVASQLPDSPVKARGTGYVAAYEKANGAGTVNTFGAHAYDAATLITAAVPAALQKAQPGTPEFRAALRDAMEHLHGVVLAHGVADMTPDDHNGLDQRARVMVTIRDGAWQLLPDPQRTN